MYDIFGELMVPIALAALGCLFLSGHGAKLIAGYNTLPRAERGKYDERALCRFMGKMMFYVVGCLLTILAGDHLPSRTLFAIGIVLLLIGIVFMVVYANTGNRFRKNR